MNTYKLLKVLLILSLVSFSYQDEDIVVEEDLVESDAVESISELLGVVADAPIPIDICTQGEVNTWTYGASNQSTNQDDKCNNSDNIARFFSERATSAQKQCSYTENRDIKLLQCTVTLDTLFSSNTPAGLLKFLVDGQQLRPLRRIPKNDENCGNNSVLTKVGTVIIAPFTPASLDFNFQIDASAIANDPNNQWGFRNFKVTCSYEPVCKGQLILDKNRYACVCPYNTDLISGSCGCTGDYTQFNAENKKCECKPETLPFEGEVFTWGQENDTYPRLICKPCGDKYKYDAGLNQCVCKNGLSPNYLPNCACPPGFSQVGNSCNQDSNQYDCNSFASGSIDSGRKDPVTGIPICVCPDNTTTVLKFGEDVLDSCPQEDVPTCPRNVPNLVTRRDAAGNLVCVCRAPFVSEVYQTIRGVRQIIECACPPGQVYNPTTQQCKPSGCNPSCVCDYNENICASCHICRICREPDMAGLIRQDYCQCKTPSYRLIKGSQWQCEKVPDHHEVDNCEWQLFNQVNKMVVHSDCSFYVDPSNDKNMIKDVISYDWRRLTFGLDEECKSKLNTQILLSKNCDGEYVPLSNEYASVITVNSFTQTTLNIPLIQVYDIATTISVEERHIYQKICLAIELSNTRKVLRQHRFELRIYTLRDQVQVFHLNVDKQYTEGCDRGQECIIVVDLDTRGDICTDSTCANFKLPNVVPTYTIGDHMYVRIQFIDNTYTKYLTVISVKFIDDQGIYEYNKNSQWFYLQQEIGYVDLDIYLFQPHPNAQVEVALKIALAKDSRLRNLAEKVGNVGDQTTQKFQVNVNKPKTTTVNAANDNSASIQVFALLALLSLLI